MHSVIGDGIVSGNSVGGYKLVGNNVHLLMYNGIVLPVNSCRLQIPRSALIPLTTVDKDKAQELLKRPYMSSQTTWKHEVNVPVFIIILLSIYRSVLNEGSMFLVFIY